MKKFLLAIQMVILCLFASAQVFNNEWIDYSKTYFKFKIGSTGLYRITQPSLAAIGLGNTSAAQFQLWRNGKEIAIYTSATGILGQNDFLEFYGEMNDGKPDKVLYRNDTLQMNDKWSILTDTACFFLTVNASGTNKRLINTPNDVAGNVLPAEQFFTYKLAKYYQSIQNPGNGLDFGEIVHSSRFEKGEGWTSPNVYAPPYGTGNIIDFNNNLFVYTAGPAASINAVAAGNYSPSRYVRLKINGDTIGTNLVVDFDFTKFKDIPVALSHLNGDVANVEFSHSGSGYDRIVVSHYELSYPRQYNFGGQTKFEFELPASGSKYLAIKNFGFGSMPPILLDLVNNQRFIGVVSGDTAKFILPSSSLARQLVLLNAETSNIGNIASFTSRTFLNYQNPAQQGDYIIISHSCLFNDGNGVDNVEKYRQYRSSAPGGSFNAKIIDIEQLTDQFAFGIKHHPLAVRNYASFALANFTVAPKYFFLIGRGLDYTSFHLYESDPNTSKLALVPTFGYPASDNLLTASRLGSTTRIPIGRLSAITGTEVGDYLEKVKQFELAQAANPQTINGKGWMKNIAQITGAINDPGLAGLITGYMDGYENILKDTLFGGKIYNFSKNSGQYAAIGSSKTIDNLINEGLSLLTYFGHSSPNSLEFNLDKPQNYSNTGKYPLIVVNGCNTGNLFTFDTLRQINKGTLSEKYVFAPQKGSIGFIASTHFGIPQPLDKFNANFAKNLTGPMYGRSIGEIMKATMERITGDFGYDFTAICHAEEITYHGDPAIKLNPSALPDFTIEDSLISFTPSIISVADDKMTISAKILNIGKVIMDSITVKIQHQLPDNSIITLANRRIKATLYEDTLQVSINMNPLIHTGLNKIIVTIDPDNLVPELSEINNTVTKNFVVIDDEIRPVYPYNYSIVNNAANFALYGSTSNTLAPSRQYNMQMDTSQLFNSPFKVSSQVASSGGIIKFLPNITLKDSTVYYWRITTGPVTVASRWFGSSFTFINGGNEGFNQSHFYQFTEDIFKSMKIDSNSRKFYFEDKLRRLLVRTGLYPHYNFDQINVNVDNDQVASYGCQPGLQFVVYNPLDLNAWVNKRVANFNPHKDGDGRFESYSPDCDSAVGIPTRKLFEFPITDSVNRRRAMQFLDSIPDGNFVSVTNFNHIYNTQFIDQWKADTVNLGSGRSLWHKFHDVGFNQIDSFTTNLPFLFIFKKGDSINFPPIQHIGPTQFTHIEEAYFIPGKQIDGYAETPWVGPSKSWNRFKWDLIPNNNPNNKTSFDIFGKDLNGNESFLTKVTTLKDTGITGISAAIYPYLKIRINNRDSLDAKAAQLKYWMLTSGQNTEGALAPNSCYNSKDTINISDSIYLKIAFKNISNIAFDSIKLRLSITNNNGLNTVFNNLQNGARLKPLAGGDSTLIIYNIPAAAYAGLNQVKLDVNPDNAQQEQFHFNNLLYKNIYVANAICPGGNVSFNCGNAVAGNTFKWQVNSGNGYVDISNGILYNGVTTSILSINNAPASMYGYKYRCIVTNANSTLNSNEFVLKFSLTWTGALSTAWENPGNWSCGTIPDRNFDVIIPSAATNYPRVNSNAVCHSLSAQPGCTIIINTGFALTTTGPGL
jgi:hypothetical protein